MSNPMIMQLKQDLAGFKHEKRELELKVKRCFAEISSCIKPYFTDYREIKAEEIEQAGDELLLLKSRLAEVEEKIIEVADSLG